MSQVIKNVVILGATGNIGPSVLTALLESGKFNVTVVTRPTSSSTVPSGVKVAKSDYSEESLSSIFSGNDAVVNTVGGAGLAVQKVSIDAAVKAGIKRFIPSEFGCDTSNAKARAICPIFEGKHDTRKYLDTQAAAHPTFSWSGVLTGPFFDWGLDFLGFDLASKAVTLYDEGNARFSATTRPTIGQAVASTLLHPAETKNQYVYVQSFAVTQNEIKAALEKATGAPWSVVKTLSSKAVGEEGRAKLAKGDFAGGIFQTILASIFSTEPVGSNFLAEHGSLDNELLGLPKEELDVVVKNVVAAHAK
ncbi:MAG: hypothetical protein M1838_003390 [Thelocarpon superellum]|nr:MAG: hypothetical protein M1838_003390 [Thelocarpon superellum]